MQATQSEFGTQPGQDYIKSLFSDVPADTRFSSCRYIQIPPVTAIDVNTTQVVFMLPARESPSCYLLGDMLMKATVVIRKSDGTSLPDQDRLVGPVNNACASLFSNLQMSINGVEITTNQTNYHYKCFLQNLISYNEVAKTSNLHLAGWCTDKAWLNTAGESTTHASLSNLGFKSRAQWFKKGYKADSSEYRPSGYTFLAPFRHELHGVTKPIPPGVRIQFILSRASDKFSLLRITKAKPSLTDDTEAYRLKLESCVLYVKIAQMSLPLYKELHSKIQHTPIRYYFRKLHMHVETLNANAESVQTNILNPDHAAPVKVYFCIVSTSAFNGDYELNPYCFQRSWMVQDKVAAVGIASEQNSGADFSQRLLAIEKKQQQSGEGKQKNKILKYKLKVLKQREELNKLKLSQAAGLSAQESLNQIDGAETDSDFSVSEDSDEEVVPPTRQTRKKSYQHFLA